MVHRFSRTELLIGQEGIAVLRASKVAIFGVGGVGSFAVEALARCGIGSMTLIDHDRIDLTNLNRQLHALTSTVGLYKIEVMGRRVQDINPNCHVELRTEYYEPERETEFLDGGYDYVVDAIDSVRAKVGLIAGCMKRRIPIISSMGAANKLDPTGFRVVDISETYNDPLARIVRRRLREINITEGLKVVFSPELPTYRPPATKDMNEPQANWRPPPGTVAFVPPVVGMIMAGVVVRDLLAASGIENDFSGLGV